ncbi:hypothetical protein Scep_027975 [Stephania cephalantha]|uniref:Uncharacterized protein n=1 Tax=Stephania cephalantha TaxID=152367 RepID=A0AAP0ECA0_9MAGN
MRSSGGRRARAAAAEQAGGGGGGAGSAGEGSGGATVTTSASARQRQRRGERRDGVVGPIGGVNRRMSKTRLRDLGCYSRVSVPVVWAFGYPVSGLGRYIPLLVVLMAN